MLEKRKGDVLHSGGHGVYRIDGTDDDRPVKGALVIPDAHAFEVGHNGEILPHLALQAVLGKLLPQNGVGFPNCLQTIPGNGTQAAHTKAGAGEGLTENHIVWQTQRLAHYTHLVLEEEAHRLHQLKLEIFRQTTHVVMRLHTAALENIRIDGALRQEFNSLQLARLFLEDTDKLCADNLALLLRFGYALQLRKEAIHSVHIDEVGIHLITEDLDDLFRLTFAQQAVIHMHTDQLFSDGADQQRRHNRGIYAAAECQQHLLIPDLGTDFFDLLGDELLRQRLGGDTLHVLGTFVA